MSDNIQTNTTGRLTPCLQQKIDKTRYLVEVHFSDTSTQSVEDKLRWSSFFVTLTRKSFDIIMPAFFFQMVSYIHWMNVGGYDCNTHIHNP